INYVTEKYGRDRVAQIITFSTMAARAAVRDAGRVLEIPYGVVDKVAKLIPEGPGQTLEECLKPGADLRRFVDSDATAKEIVELARPLEGLTRADSIHAAGVVIGAEPLIDVVPLQQKGSDQEVVTQFSMGDVEALGLLKMDFLGLRNLDVIEKAAELAGGLEISKITLDDPKVYEMLSRGEAAGVIQIKSSGMRKALRQLRSTEFKDLSALRALYPCEYMAALISSVMNTKDRVPFYVNACHELGIEVLPPDVNESQIDFAVVGGKIRFGLNALKGVGEIAARTIVRAREEGGPFESIWDFTERVDPSVVNKRALESLVKC